MFTERADNQPKETGLHQNPVNTFIGIFLITFSITIYSSIILILFIWSILIVFGQMISLTPFM